jgi:hypothetical protein
MTYRYPNGTFAGVVVIESNTLINTRMRVALSDADKGLSFMSSNVLYENSASQVPVELLGRRLGSEDLRKFERKLVKKRRSSTEDTRLSRRATERIAT